MYEELRDLFYSIIVDHPDTVDRIRESLMKANAGILPPWWDSMLGSACYEIVSRSSRT